MKPSKLFRHWRQRRHDLQTASRKLVRQCRRKGDVVQVHTLRVTLRRLRLFIRAGRPLLDSRAVSAFRAWARELSKLTSPVRDLDVGMEWLQQEKGAAPAIALCQAARDRLWLKAHRQLRRPPPGLLAALRRESMPSKEASARLAKRVRKLEARYASAVKAGLPRFFTMSAGAQHDFRRRLRWWRYLRELQLPARRQPGDRLLAALVAAQETTGDRQNLALAMTALTRHARRAGGAHLRARLQRAQALQRRKIERSLAALARLRPWPVQSSSVPASTKPARTGAGIA